MARYWIIIIVILLALSFLIWGQTKWCGADVEEYQARKILKKLDKVLQNQDLILKELKELKK